jgi:hypothetical protein
MKTIMNDYYFRRFALFSMVLVLWGTTTLWAGGWKDQIESVTAEGGEVWENDFDVTTRKKGLYNFIVFARDRAGNESVSGPFNVRVDPNAGLPVARVVYPEPDAVIRQNINIMGVASARYGVDRVLVRLDNDEYKDVTGTEYWNHLLDFTDVPDGRHTLRIMSYDSKGVPGPEQSLSFILDTTPPAIELTSHVIGDLISGSVNVRGRVSDPNGIRGLEYSEDGEKFVSLSGRKRGGKTLDFTLPIQTRRMEDGPLMYYLRAVDMTGVAAVKPCLFFVSNSGPELEVYTPTQGEDVYGVFFLTGRAYNTIGISRLYYEYGRLREDIETRPGDPFWSIALTAGKNTAASVKVVAIDKAGNVSSVTRKLEDRRKVKTPTLVIDYPPPEELDAMRLGIPADTAIYGHIAPDIAPRSIMVEGYGEVEAVTSFRIAPHMMPAGKRAQTIKITPVSADGIIGNVVKLRYLKQASMTQGESEINVAFPEKNSWLSGHSVILRGNVVNPQNMELEYRLDPYDRWYPLRMDVRGNFAYELAIPNRPQGPVHLEFRTVQYGQANYPVYHPFNWAVSQPNIEVIAPVGDYATVYGSKTVSAVVEHSVPVYRITYSLNQMDFEEIPFYTRYGKAWFSYFCDFNTMSKTRGSKLVFRVTDASGAEFEAFPEYTFDPDPPVPTIIVNSPTDDEVITNPFEISGLAYYDVDIYGVYWRLLGPKMESLSPGPAGEEARRYAAVFRAYPDISFQELKTEQNFAIPVDFSMITDGEYTLEIFAADIYGMRSEVVSRTIKVSTLPPETQISSPVITRYNQGAITVRGVSSDANGIDNVMLSMDNGNTYQTVNLHNNDNWDIALNTAAYTDGVYSAFIRTVDKYGVTTFSNAMVNIDNTSPELFLTYPANGQYVGSNLRLMGRVDDNIKLKSLTFQIISARNPNFQRIENLSIESSVIFDTISLEGFAQGEYTIRLVAKDLADNEALVSRKITYDPDDKAAEIAIFNPLPGEVHSGPVNVVGIVTGSFLPEDVRLMMNGTALGFVPVDRYGIFHYEIPETLLEEDGTYRISANYNAETGKVISSPNHTLYYSNHGPILYIASHQDGDVITGRPWLSGSAWISVAEPTEEDAPTTRREQSEKRAERKVESILVSNDNGRSFQSAKGGDQWRFRLETSELPRGPQPILVRAIFANGEEAVRRLMVYVDTTIPQVETISPPEDSTHRDNIITFGTAGDNYELANVDVSLRPHDKFFYSVPGPLQGMYFDVKGLGATYFDVGLGLSLFDDNVRFQFQYGLAPADGESGPMHSGGRFVGHVVGIKLLANIFSLPFAYLFGLDWAFYKMNFAVGANFSYFLMDDWRSPLFMGAIVGQWDIANINFRFFRPDWKYFRNYALYMEPELWFASTDVQGVEKLIPRVTFGLRINWF